MRTFIAIDLDPEIKSRICSLIGELDTGKKNVRWIKRHALHITLKFCGTIALSKVDSIKHVLDDIGSKTRSFPLTIEGTGCFPEGSRKPRVLWVGIGTSPPLNALQRELDAELSRLGFTKEQRPFSPHLTLGRVKFTAGLGQILDRLDGLRDRSFGTMSADRVTFYQSILKPTGAEYTILHEVKLQ